MAIELMARIWARPRSEVDSSEKWVLTVMSDRADDEGLLWYAVDTIADLTSFTPRAVQKIMDRLVVKRLVKKLQRTNRSNYYVIQVDRFPPVERKRKTKEAGPKEFVAELDAEPDLFGTGERRSSTGERRSSTGEPGSATGEPGSPDSLIDSLNDSPTDARESALVGETSYEFVLRSWNEIAAEHEALPPVRFLSDERKRLIELRTDDAIAGGVVGFGGEPVHESVWRPVFRAIAGSRLLTGQKTDWAPTLDWVLKKSNFAKIIGGNYGHGPDNIASTAARSKERSAVAAGSEARGLVERARARRRPDPARPRGPGGRAAGAGR